MSTVMEFWGVEVKSGQSLKIDPGDSRVVHLSQASLGEVKKDRASESVYLYLKVGDKKLVLGTLSAEKFPQLSVDLVIENDFELSHNWKNGSVYFTGYKVHMEGGTDGDEDDSSDSDKVVKQIPLVNNGKPELQAKSVSRKPNDTKAGASTVKQNVKDAKLSQKDVDSDSDNSDLNGSSSDDDEDPNLVNHETRSEESGGELDESDEEDNDEGTDDSESDDDEETPKKAVPSKKRPAESATKTPVPEKKTKFVTPQKTEGKKRVGHTATPHPSKKAGKALANSDQMKPQTQKSGGSYPCKSCSRSFTTEGGLQAHTKAKHSTAA